MHTFQLHIPPQFILDNRITSNYYIGVSYEIIDNRVVLISTDIPIELLPKLIINTNLADYIYQGAEHNSIELRSSQPIDIFQVLGEYFKPHSHV